MPHFRPIVLHALILGQNRSLNCFLNRCFRFRLKGIVEQTQTVIFTMIEKLQEELTSDGRFLTFELCTL